MAKPERAFVIIFNEEHSISETALLSEAALAKHWIRPEEDAAWEYLRLYLPSQFLTYSIQINIKLSY